MVNDLISDTLIRIKNGYLAQREMVEVPRSKATEKISQILVREGFLAKMEPKERKLFVTLKYEGKEPAMTEVKRISKPAARRHVKAAALPKVLGGKGIAIISTPKGILTDSEARKMRVGGEVLAKIW